MAGVDLARLGGADHEPPADAGLVLEELERVGALVGDVDQPSVGRQVPRPEDPEPALAGRAVAVLGEGLVLGDLVAAVQELIDQPEHVPRIGRHGQDIVAEIAAVVPLADLAQVAGQRAERGVVQLGGVVQEEHVPGVVAGSGQRVGPRRGEEGLVRHAVGVAEAVEGAEVRGRGHLVGQGAAGVGAHPVERFDQPRGATPIAQLGGGEDLMTQAGRGVVVRRHGGPSGNGSSVGLALPVLRTHLRRGPVSNPPEVTTDARSDPQGLPFQGHSTAARDPTGHDFRQSGRGTWSKT